jgi:hypothetical protein
MRNTNKRKNILEANQVLITSGPNVDNPDEEELKNRVNLFADESPQHSPTKSSPHSSNYQNKIELVKKLKMKKPPKVDIFECPKADFSTNSD